MESHPEEGVVKEEMFPNTRKPSYQRVCREFRNLRGQHNQAGVGGGGLGQTHNICT